MGGKKGPEQNRKYEKDRRDRFNNQFIELSKLLPDFNSSAIKVTKAEIIGRTIQYLQDTQLKNKKLDVEYENEKSKIDELQKRVAGLLQIVEELITLLRKAGVDFPTSLPLDDFVTFKEAYLKCKRKLKENNEDERSKRKKLDSTDEESELPKQNDVSEGETLKTKNISSSTTTASITTSNTITNVSNNSTFITTTVDNLISTIQTSDTPAEPPKSITTTVMNLEAPSVLRLDSNSLILPSANILTVNGLQSTVINSINNSQTLLVNKQIAVPTFILMQNNNLIPVCSLPQANLSQQRPQKLIVPKQSNMSTKTTFINKKPIPAVCLYKSSASDKDTVEKSANSLNVKRKKSKRSKGILVKYPKRKPPNKNKKSSTNQKQKPKPAESSSTNLPNQLLRNKDYPLLETCGTNEKTNSNENNTFTAENCYSINENTYSENDISKNYSCPDNIFDTTDNQNNEEFGSKNVQFIDFFENNSTRSVENTNENVHSVDSTQYVGNSENACDKMNKSGQNPPMINNYNDHLDSSFVDTGNFSNANINCNDVTSNQPKEPNELKNGDEKNTSNCVNESPNHVKSSNSTYHHLPTSCEVTHNNSLLMKFVPNSSSSVASHECDKNYPQSMDSNFGASLIKDLHKNNTNNENELSKSKQTGKEITPLTIQCSMPENKSLSKELTLSLIEERKNYENVSSFDEFPNDLFTSLQVPASGQNTDSISPTAAFLLTFPLVSSCKNVDLLPEHEHDDDNGNTTPTTSATILQIGNLESPSTLLFTSSKFFGRDNQKSTTERLSFSCSKGDESVYSSTFCNNVLMSNDMSNADTTRKEKIKDINKDNEIRKQYIPMTRSDGYNCNNDTTFGLKNNCVNKELEAPISQNISFYTPSCSSSTFPSYNIFTKYNDIPPVTAPYYSLGSQPFGVTKSSTADPMTDFNSWVTVPSVYNQEIDTSKEKAKRDKCTSTHSFRNTKLNDFSTNISTFGLSLNDINTPTASERSKIEKTKKPQKQSNARLVNWMTSPDLRNAPDTSHQSHPITDNFLLQKDESIGANSFLNNAGISNVQNNSAFSNVAYSSSEYFLENQNYVDSQNLNNCKVSFSSSNPTSYSWSPSKSTLPAISHLDTHNMMIPSTLPTLVGDLALSNSNTTGPIDKIFNNYDLLSKKHVPEVDKQAKRNTCKNFYKSDRMPVSNPQSSFLSVTQLVDDKDRAGNDKFSSKNNVKSTTKLGITSGVDENCQFENDINRDKYNYLRGKENYSSSLKPPENADYSAKKNTYVNNPGNISCTVNTSKTDSAVDPVPKNNQNLNIKCKNKELKYNVNRCLVKESKKDTRPINQSQQQKPSFNGYVTSSNNPAGCDNVVLNKGANPLSNKNSNYSAESLISSSNHQNSCTSQNYFPYENTSNYANCSSNDYARRRIESNETESSLTNVGYYTNTNYVYPNNFQSFNNYGFSNQCYNNYPTQIQHTSLQKKTQKEDAYKQDTDWYKESFSTHYSSIMSNDFDNHQNKTDKCKQSFPTTKYNAQKITVNNSNVNNTKYYNYNATASTNNSKNNCSLNSSYSFSQSSQQVSETTCLAPNYDMKSNRNSGIVNSNNAHPATSLTNFNLSAIFPEINDKHCNQNRVNTIGSEKKDTNYSNSKINSVDDMNYNYLIQPSAENNPETVSVYSSSSFQIQHFTDFASRKSQK